MFNGGYTTETIQLTPTSRLRVEVDDSPSNPRVDWDMLTGFVKIEGRGDSRIIDVPPVHESPIPIRDAWDRLAYLLQARYTPDEAHVERWARIFHGMHIEYDSEHGGFWFVDPSAFQQNFPAVPGGGKVARMRLVQVDGLFQADVYETYEQDALECQAEIIEAERETYRLWAEGEVYGVILERAETYAKVKRNERAEVWELVNPLTDADITQEWEVADSVWDCYLDEKYTAQVVAAEHWSLTDAEYAALGLAEGSR